MIGGNTSSRHSFDLPNEGLIAHSEGWGPKLVHPGEAGELNWCTLERDGELGRR